MTIAKTLLNCNYHKTRSSGFDGYVIAFFYTYLLGIGVALSYVTILLSVNKYSYKNRSLSMTLTSLGGSVTSVVFPLIVRTLLQTYGFRGAMLIHSAILLNTVICGAVVFPVISKGISIFSD